MTLIRGGTETACDPAEIVEGDHVRLRQGDQAVVDGTVLAGTVEIDESLLTGQSEPERKARARVDEARASGDDGGGEESRPMTARHVLPAAPARRVRR